MGTEVVTAAHAQREIEKKKQAQFRFCLLLVETDLPPNKLALKIADGDRKKASAWRKRYQRWRQEPEFAQMMAGVVNGSFVTALPQVSNALIRRATKGNVPAIKLLMEASGFYSPRHTVDHTGEIAVVLKGGHRPPVVDDGPVVDATVVE